MFVLNEFKLIKNILETKEKDISDNYFIRILARMNRDLEYDDLVEHVFELTKNVKMKTKEPYKIYELVQSCVKDEMKKNVELKSMDYIYVSDKEFEKICSCETEREKKFLFTCYILGRLNDNGWINVDDTTIFSLSNISLSKNERKKFIFNMIQNGYITTTKSITNNAIHIDLIDGEEKYKVHEIKNLGNFILSKIKVGYRQCESCEKLFKAKSNSQKFCVKCGEKVRN